MRKPKAVCHCCGGVKWVTRYGVRWCYYCGAKKQYGRPAQTRGLFQTDNLDANPKDWGVVRGH